MSKSPARQMLDGTAFIQRGSRGEHLLLIHGVGLNAEAWEPQIEAFASTHQVIAMDMLGHGHSELPPEDATIDTYVMQAVALLDRLGIERVNVIGHSMGGLVAIGLALRHPRRVMRLGVLNSVHERDPQARAAVEARAREIADSSSTGDIEMPLTRWFGTDESAVKAKVRAMLKGADPSGYAIAYRVFATSDRVHSGRLGALTMPALFATGGDDPNSTESMAHAMASATLRGKTMILPGQRHMMNLTAPQDTNEAISLLLAEPTTAIDANDLRRAFGTFMTGVTIVTTLDETGQPRGFTANSFTSVSLDPPLLLICIAKKAASYATFSQAPSFAVNILSENQKTTSGIFASKRPDKFSEVSWHSSASGNPLIEGSAAWFDCARHRVIDAGDHIILLGAIRSFHYNDASPLGYARGGYVSLGLEQAAVNAATGGHTIVGAILECDGQLVMRYDAKADRWYLPEAGRNGHSGSASLLQESLHKAGIETDLGFLFAVFENPQTKVQSIYYRGEASLRPTSSHSLVPFDAIDWAKLPDDAIRVMLRRYADERLQGRFKVYSGDHVHGEIKPIV